MPSSRATTSLASSRPPTSSPVSSSASDIGRYADRGRSRFRAAPLSFPDCRAAGGGTAVDVTFERLFKSIDRSTFVRDYLDQRVLHEAGSVQDVGRLFSWAKLNELLDRPTLWDGRSVEMAVAGRILDPREYCRPGIARSGEQNLRPDRQRVTPLLQKGATFWLHNFDGHSVV